MSETIHLADEEIANFDKNLPITKENNPQNEFSKSSAGYYRCKKRDSALYLLLKKEYSRYVSDDKLKECCHEYDTNINESLNNIVSKYAPKCRHYSKSVELRTRIYIAGSIYLTGHHYFWSKVHDSMGIAVSEKLNNSWLAKDINKVEKYGREHTFEYKKIERGKKMPHCVRR